MKKVIIILLLIFTYQLHSLNEYEDNYIKLKWSSTDFTIEEGFHNIRQDKNQIYIHLQYSFRYKEELSNLFILLKMKDVQNINDLMETLRTDKIIKNPSFFGMGEIYSYSDKIGLTKLTDNTKRFGVSWGTNISNDILIYKINNENKYVKETLVQVLNVWPKETEMPYPLNNKDIDIMINNNDSRVIKYVFLDNLFSNNFELKPFYEPFKE